MAAVLTSITGLQKLVNLVGFRADYNALQTIDLSNLKNLLDVDISDNDEIGSTGLKSINLNGCTALAELRLDDNDFSAGLPALPNSPVLGRLDFDQCNISGTINLSGRSSLYNIDFYGNPGITSANITGCTSLEFVNFGECSLNQTSVDNILTTLDTSGLNGGNVYLDGGTNAEPSVAGQTAKTNLEGKGWYVSVNLTTTTTTEEPTTTTSTTEEPTTTTTTTP